jgi:hypothetical protein
MGLEAVELADAPEGFIAIRVGDFMLAQRIEGGPVKQLAIEQSEPHKVIGRRFTGPPTAKLCRVASPLVHTRDGKHVAERKAMAWRIRSTWQHVEVEVEIVGKDMYLYWPDGLGGWWSVGVFPPLYPYSPQLQREYFDDITYKDLRYPVLNEDGVVVENRDLADPTKSFT